MLENVSNFKIQLDYYLTNSNTSKKIIYHYQSNTLQFYI